MTRSLRLVSLRAVTTLTATVVVGSLTVTPASAATLVGATAAPVPALCAAPNTVVPAAAQYAVPAAGVITSWQFQASASVPQLKLKVFRSTGAGSFTVTGSSDARTPVAATLNTFAVRVPVTAGDVIGLALLTAGECITSGSGNFSYVPGDAAVGSTQVYTQTTGTLDVAANVEPDADGNGYGDETQDGCPSQAASHGACLPPATTAPDRTAPVSKFTAGPKRTTKSTAKFAFTSDDPGARFECRITGKQVRTIQLSTFQPCTSPKKYKHLAVGNYKVSVRAIDASGNVEAAPPTVKLRVQRKKKA